jgi:hypothetical protein
MGEQLCKLNARAVALAKEPRAAAQGAVKVETARYDYS